MLAMGQITIAFDDGYRDTYASTARFLADKGISATYAVSSEHIGKTLENRPVVTADEIAELRRLGHEIASHTVNHLNLLKLYSEKGEEAARYEMESSKTALEKVAGVCIESFVFPFIDANNDARLRQLASEYYKSARITSEHIALNSPLANDKFSLIGLALTTDMPLSGYNGVADIAAEHGLWLIEVFHLVSDKNTASATKNAPYRFYMTTENFKAHVEYILSKKIRIVTQGAGYRS
jgi:peptidoglycan/xylan/chitin deacetylase (PgdA/CDA1 family)